MSTQTLVGDLPIEKPKGKRTGGGAAVKGAIGRVTGDLSEGVVYKD